MKIDYVVISSDNNPLYTDFYEPVSKIWNHFGYKTFMIEICDEESDIFETDFGIYKKIKSVCENTGLQAQTSRLFSSNLLQNKNLLLSDIDMAPLDIEYFESRAENIKEDQILLYTGQPYGVNPFYPMCYVLGNSNVLSKALDIQNKSFSEFISYLQHNYKGDTEWGTIWNTDENFLYDKLESFDNKIILRDRDLNKRVNRVNWYWEKDKVENGYYVDSHLLRPYLSYKNQIDELLSVVLNKPKKSENYIDDFISGEKIAKIADYIFFENAPTINDVSKNIENIKSDKKDDVIIYTRPWNIPSLSNYLYHNNVNKKVTLIVHNSDDAIDYRYINYYNRFSKIFGQNINIKMDNIFSIPIGLENSYNFPEIKKIEQMKLKLLENKNFINLLYINHYVPNNFQERNRIYQIFEGKDFCTIHRGINGQNFVDYLHNIYNHKFVICPEGNGIDTHRTWECLYLGTIPIEKRNINNSFYEGKLPICFVDDWSEINADFLEKEFEKITSKKWSNEMLTFTYWNNKIKNNN